MKFKVGDYLKCLSNPTLMEFIVIEIIDEHYVVKSMTGETKGTDYLISIGGIIEKIYEAQE